MSLDFDTVIDRKTSLRQVITSSNTALNSVSQWLKSLSITYACCHRYSNKSLHREWEAARKWHSPVGNPSKRMTWMGARHRLSHIVTDLTENPITSQQDFGFQIKMWDKFLSEEIGPRGIESRRKVDKQEPNTCLRGFYSRCWTRRFIKNRTTSSMALQGPIGKVKMI